MINTNKKWLLTASPWMKYGFRLSSLGTKGIFLCALLILAGLTGKSQGRYGYFGWGGGGLPSLSVITGNTTICVGTTTTLSDATPGGVWSSSNTAIATVGSTGIVTGQHGGFVNINYTVGIISIGTMVTVTYPIMGSSSVCVGNNTFLIDSTPTGNWSSSNPAIANVLPSGEVDGIAAGTATITYGRTGACSVPQLITVNANGTAPILGTGSLGVCAGGSVTVSDATPLGVWSCSNTAVATINSSTGLINGLVAGGATITYNAGGCFVTKPLIVSSATALLPITGASAVCVGNTVQMSDATPMGTWSSSNSSLAYVNTAGLVTATGAGAVTISYNKTGCSVTHALIINANTVAPITGNSNVCIGGTTSLADATPSGGWSSSNTTLATVAGGLVTGVAAGAPYITYSVLSTGCFQTAAVVVNPATSVGLVNGTSTVCQGAITNLSDAVLGGTWSTVNTTIASVNSFGAVTGLASGTATITYTRLGCTALDVVTVNPLPAAITGARRECAVNTGTTTQLSDASAGGTWSIANTNYATINSATGLVTGVAPGVVNITYTLPSGCFVASTDTAYGPPAIAGGNIACIAPLTYLYLSEPAYIGGAWSSRSTSIATISGSGSTGAVTGVAPGIDTIKYTVSYSGLSCYVAQAVTVNFDPGIISGYTTACAGGGTTVLADTTASGVWSSANTTIATVGSATGIVTGAAAGGTIISYTKNGCIRTANITVVTPPSAITGTLSVCAGLATTTLSETSTGGSWSASNGNINIAPLGPNTELITGVTAGTTTVSYTLNGCATNQVVTVVANSGVTSMTGAPVVCTGLVTTLSSGITGGGAGAWTSSNTAIAAFSGSTSGGVVATAAVLGVSAGTAVITYTNSANGCFKTSVVAVHTQPAAVNGTTSICNGTSTTFTDASTGGAWTSGDAHIASVGSSGLVSGITVGLTTITYALPGGCESYKPVYVNAMPSAWVGATAACNTSVVAVYDSLPGGMWTSSNIAVATIGSTSAISANVTGVKAGTTNITYTVGACYVSKAFTVGSVVPTFVSGPINICANGTASNNIIVSDSLGTFSTRSTAVGSIAAKGKSVQSDTAFLTGVSADTLTVIYTLNGCIATQVDTISVNTMPAIVGSPVICTGSSATLSEAVGGGTWTSSITTVATVGSASGSVTGVANGSTIITYAVANGGCRQFLSVNVGTGPAAIAGSPTVCLNQNDNLSDAVTGGTWASSNYSIANVGSTGVVTGSLAGSATITYTASGCSVTQAVTVNPNPSSIAGIMAVCAGSTNTTLSDPTAGGAWTSSNTSIATIDPVLGTVTGVLNGNSTITYALTATGCYATSTMKVGATPPIAGTFAVCNWGATTTTLSDLIGGGTWTSSNTVVATIDPLLGTVTGLFAGSTTITYSAVPGCTSTAAFTVGAIGATITGTTSVCTTATTTLSTSIAGGVWSSGTTTVATNSSNVYTGVSVGTSLISYTTPGCAPSTAILTVGYTTPILGSNSMCETLGMTLSDATLGGAWASSNTSIATINPVSGVVAGTGSGFDTITYSAGGCVVSYSIFSDGSCRLGGNTISITDVNADQVYTLFPNPSRGTIYIGQSIPVDGAMQVSLINYVGEKVYTGAIQFISGKGELNLSAPSGMYLVLLQDKDGKTQTFKVLIEKY